MGRSGKKRAIKVTAFLQSELARYDATQFPEEILYRDQVASTLGAPVDGWTPELVFRYTVCQPLGLNVDWAIMINARRVEDGGSGPRRRVERIDICHSEVHIHRFRIGDDPDDDLGERSTIISLYAGDEVTVSQQWDLQMQLLSREWPKRMRRWLDG